AALRAARPSEEMTTRWCSPAPWESMATWGVPSGDPASSIGWQITSRHPSRLGCLRVATTLPSTRASSIRKFRRAKFEIRNKSEFRHPRVSPMTPTAGRLRAAAVPRSGASAPRATTLLGESYFGLWPSDRLRHSDFGLISDFGFRHSDLINTQIVHHHAAADTTERLRIGNALAGGRGDRVTQVAFAAQSQAGHARAVFDEERRVQGPGH